MRFLHAFRILSGGAIIWLALLPTSLLASPKVLVSLKPVELLVRAVATDNISVTTLVPPGSNPHSYAMKPSQRKALGEADAIFWIGPDMESFLTNLLTGSDFKSRSHALNADWNAGKTGDHHAGHHHDHHAHDSENDPHLWLDPALARAMVQQIHTVLTTLPDADTAALDANLAAFEQTLTKTEADIHRQLQPAMALSLFTYHNAFSHFAEHYSLNLAGVLALNPDLSPGARHIAVVQEQLRKADHPCLMTELPFNPENWQAIVGDTQVVFSAWDPLATSIKADAGGYFALQRGIADAVLDCLPEQAEH